MKTDGAASILTEGFANEGPVWSPNGRGSVFPREQRCRWRPKLWTVDVAGYNEQPVPVEGWGIRPGMVAAIR